MRSEEPANDREGSCGGVGEGDEVNHDRAEQLVHFQNKLFAPGGLVFTWQYYVGDIELSDARLWIPLPTQVQCAPLLAKHTRPKKIADSFLFARIRTVQWELTVPVHKHKLAASLRRFGAVEHVLARAPLSKRDLTRLHKHRNERLLTLIGIQADSFEFISDWVDLRSLRLYSCKVGDWSRLARLKRLKDLFINGIRHPAPDVSFLSQLGHLEELGIGNVRHLIGFPDMSRCTRLKRLSIFGCKRLKDLSAILRIPNLESFHIVLTPQEPTDLEAIMAMPKMKIMSGAFGNKKKNALFHELLGKHGLVYG